MNSRIKSAHQLSYWLLGALVLIAFVLADVAAVALPAAGITAPQLLAGAAAFFLISFGVLYTVWYMEKR